METGYNAVIKDESSISQTECRKKQRTKISNPYVKTAQIIPTSNSTEETKNVSSSSRTFVTRGGTFTVSQNHRIEMNNDLLSKPNNTIQHDFQHNQATQPVQLPTLTSFQKKSLNDQTSSSKQNVVSKSTQRSTKISNPYLRKPKSMTTKSLPQNSTSSNSIRGNPIERENCSSSMHRIPSKDYSNQDHQSISDNFQVSLDCSNDNKLVNRNLLKPSKQIHNPSSIIEENGCTAELGSSLNSQSKPSEVTDTSSAKVSGIKRKIDDSQTNQISDESHKIRKTFGVIHTNVSSDAEIHKYRIGVQENNQQSPEILESNSNSSDDNQPRNDSVMTGSKPFLGFKKVNSPTKYLFSRGMECKEHRNLGDVSENTKKNCDISVSKINSKYPASENKSTNSESLRPPNIQIESKPTSKSGFLFPDPCTVDKNNSQSRKAISNNKCRTESKINTQENASSNVVGSKSTPKDPLKSTVNNSHLSHLPTLPDDLTYSYNRIAPVNDEFKKELIKNANLSEEFKNGWKLLPHQKQGILRAILMRRIVLAFDMGLGKTLIACVWAKAFQKTFENLNVFVISPVSLKKEWERTAKDVVGLEVKDDEKKKKSKPPKNSISKLLEVSKQTEIDLTGDQSDDSSECISEPKSPPIEIFSWAKIPSRVSSDIDRFIVICDEAHSMQNIESIRTKGALKLINDKRCIGTMLLTGTPMKNGKPSNLFPLLKAVRHPFGDNQKRYETFFCNGHQKQIGPTFKVIWDANGSSNLSILNAHITSHVFHKTKEMCLKELPPKSREYKKVPVSSRYELKYTNALNEIAKIQNSKFEDKECKQELLLQSIGTIRTIAAFAKVDATVSMVQSILKRESSIVIFTNFVKVAKEVHRKLSSIGWSGELMTGETPPPKRQLMVDNFQDGISAVFICTFGVGGVGLTLTAACTIVLLDRPWTPGEALQAEDRVRRIGQTRPVKSIWMRAFELDEKLDDMIEHKNQNSSTVVSGGHKSTGRVINEHKSQPKVPIFELINSMVSKQSADSGDLHNQVLSQNAGFIVNCPKGD